MPWPFSVQVYYYPTSELYRFKRIYSHSVDSCYTIPLSAFLSPVPRSSSRDRLMDRRAFINRMPLYSCISSTSTRRSTKRIAHQAKAYVDSEWPKSRSFAFNNTQELVAAAQEEDDEGQVRDNCRGRPPVYPSFTSFCSSKQAYKEL